METRKETGAWLFTEYKLQSRRVIIPVNQGLMAEIIIPGTQELLAVTAAHLQAVTGFNLETITGVPTQSRYRL